MDAGSEVLEKVSPVEEVLETLKHLDMSHRTLFDAIYTAGEIMSIYIVQGSGLKLTYGHILRRKAAVAATLHLQLEQAFSSLHLFQ